MVFLSLFPLSPLSHPVGQDCVIARNKLQGTFLNQSKNGIPITFINEGLHGGAPGGTVFPEPITQAMSWNVSMVGAIASAIAAEASAIGVDTVFAPVVNMMPGENARLSVLVRRTAGQPSTFMPVRPTFTLGDDSRSHWGCLEDPRFGRLQEGFGENPTIASHMARASVLALQGGPGYATDYLPEHHVCSLGKHYAGPSCRAVPCRAMLCYAVLCRVVALAGPQASVRCCMWAVCA